MALFKQPARAAKPWNWLAHSPTDAPAATLLIRLMAGGVFL
jgi:hypothetical protein